MTLRLREVALDLNEAESLLPVKVAAELGIPENELLTLTVVRSAVDARRKPRILRVFTVEFTVADQEKILLLRAGHPRLEVVPTPPAEVPLARCPSVGHRSLVVGMGPAGLFAALHLARCGAQVTLVERGRQVERRVRDVEAFWNGRGLDPESNVQFGEGGAGTFSDGKLTTRINNPAVRQVLETLVACGAPVEILVQAKPHVGTDRLRLVLINFRRLLQSLGVELHFATRLDGLATMAGQVRAGLCGGMEIPCDSLVLAPGHSARDTYAMLADSGVAMESKPFAVGLRVEHPAELINRIQYGLPGHPSLPPADYSLAWNDPESGRGVYSFCMCPGGEVVIASSEPGRLVVNGMSKLKRCGAFSNSALVVAVRPSDFPGSDPLAGVAFQRRWEEAAFALGGGSDHAPAQNLLAFLGRGTGPLLSSARPGVREADLHQCLPPFVTEGLSRALPHFERRMRGFISVEATLVGVETRTSAPLRILRGADGQSPSHRGLFPAGEGAGHAGGIISAALDGLRAAQSIVSHVCNGGNG